MRSKIIAAGLAVMGAALIGAGGTYAAFSDSEQAAPVLVEAGRLDLTLGTGSGTELQPVTFADMVPGPAPTADSYLPSARNYLVRLTNDGTLPGRAQWASRSVSERENDCLAPETAAGDTSCGRGDRDGELGRQMLLTFSLLPHADCTGTPGVVPPESYRPTGDHDFDDIKPGGAGPQLVLQPGESRCVRVDAYFPSTRSNNLAQGDSSTFQLSFRLDQL